MWIRRLNRALLATAVCGTLVTRGPAQERPAADRTASMIENLRARDVDVRRDAANGVRMAGRDVQRKALPVMIELLMKEKDGQVRLAVLDAVTALGHDAEAAVPALVHTLRTNYGGDGLEESHQDYRSALALAAIGRPAVEGLRGLLKERKESVRAEVVMAMGRIGPDAAAAVPDLIPSLGDKSERIRREASLALGRIGPAALEPMIAASGREDAAIRARAVEAMGHLSAPDDRARQAVLRRVHDPAPEVRAESVRSLGRLHVPDDVLVPILAEDLRHADERVRLAVVELLVARRALLPRLATEFEALLTARDDGVARHAAFLLGKLGPEAIPRLLGALRRPDSRVDQIAGALAQIGRPAAMALMQAVKDPEPRVRRAAALAMGEIRPPAPDTAQALAVALGDPDREVRAASLTAIGQLGPRAAESVPAVRGLLEDRSAEVRTLAIDVLARSSPRDERLLGDLAPMLDDPDARVQRRAIEALGSLGPPGRKVLPAVIKKLGSTSPEVRLSAVEFVGSHGQAAAEAIPALAALLDDPKPRIRMVAAQTLGSLGRAAQPAFPRLVPLLVADQPDIREAAVAAMGSLELEAEVIRPHIAKALRDDKPEVRRAASRAVQRLGPQGAILIPDIIMLADRKENLRSAERLLRRFERSGPDARSLPELVKLLEHKQPSVRLLAIKFLGLAGRSAIDAIPTLERMREDPDAEVRKQAQAACERIKKRPASADQASRPASPTTVSPR